MRLREKKNKKDQMQMMDRKTDIYQGHFQGRQLSVSLKKKFRKKNTANITKCDIKKV